MYGVQCRLNLAVRALGNIGLIPEEVLKGAHEYALRIPDQPAVMVAYETTTKRFFYVSMETERDILNGTNITMKPVLHVETVMERARRKATEREWKEGEDALRKRSPAAILAFIAAPEASEDSVPPLDATDATDAQTRAATDALETIITDAIDILHDCGPAEDRAITLQRFLNAKWNQYRRIFKKE